MKMDSGKIILFLFFFPLSAFAQFTDFGVWSDVLIKKKIAKKVSLDFNIENRLNHFATNYYLSKFDVGFEVRVFKFLDVSAAYVVNVKETVRKGTSVRHQFSSDITLKKKVRNFSFSDRNRFESKVNDYFREENLSFQNYYRNKLTVKYALFRRVEPFLAQEFYVLVNGNNPWEIRRSRSYGGVGLKLFKKADLELYYLLQKQIHENDPETDHVAGIGLKIDLK